LLEKVGCLRSLFVFEHVRSLVVEDDAAYWYLRSGATRTEVWNN